MIDTGNSVIDNEKCVLIYFKGNITNETSNKILKCKILEILALPEHKTFGLLTQYSIAYMLISKPHLSCLFKLHELSVDVAKTN